MRTCTHHGSDFTVKAALLASTFLRALFLQNKSVFQIRRIYQDLSDKESFGDTVSLLYSELSLSPFLKSFYCFESWNFYGDDKTKLARVHDHVFLVKYARNYRFPPFLIDIERFSCFFDSEMSFSCIKFLSAISLHYRQPFSL